MTYTPTTDDVRDEWIESGQGSPTVRLHAGAAFHRWLAAHDAEVAAQALREATDLPNEVAALEALPVGTVIRIGTRAYVHTAAWEWVETVTGTACTAAELDAEAVIIYQPKEES